MMAEETEKNGANKNAFTMTDSTGNGDQVRYSLLSDQDRQNSDEDLLDGDREQSADADNDRVVTMTRMSFTPAKGVAGKLRGSQRFAFLTILVAFLVIIIWLLTGMDTSDSNEMKGATMSISFEGPLRADGSSKADDLKTDSDSEKVYAWFHENCYKKDIGRSIGEIYEKLILLKNSVKEECHLIWQIFDASFRIQAIEAPIKLPILFQEEVKGWLGHNDKLFEQVNHQVVYKVSNKGTFEETVFNPIRSKRPQSKATVDPLVYIRNLTESTQPTCDFCRYKDHTAEDTFGRIESELSASCSNTFKLAKFHGLFFPKQHSPLNLTLEQIEDLYLSTSMKWFKKAHETDNFQVYPSLLFDTLPHSGASQVHPHIHGILDEHQYVGRFEAWHQISLQYYKRFKRSFWSDFVKLHFALGLGVSKGNAIVIIPLAARKDHEFMILSPSMNKDVANLIHRVLQTYQNNLGVYCFSSAGVYPKMGETSDKGMPVIFRFGSRGTCSSVSSDVSSLELYSINNINSDLAKTYDGLMQLKPGL